MSMVGDLLRPLFVQVIRFCVLAMPSSGEPQALLAAQHSKFFAPCLVIFEGFCASICRRLPSTCVAPSVAAVKALC